MITIEMRVFVVASGRIEVEIVKISIFVNIKELLSFSKLLNLVKLYKELF